MSGATNPPLMRIRAGIEAGNADEVLAGVAEAEKTGVTIAPNVRQMITQWLSVNVPEKAAALSSNGTDPAPLSDSLRPAAASPAVAAPEQSEQNTGSGENVTAGGGSGSWTSTAEKNNAVVGKKPEKVSPDMIRTALLRFFEGAPKGSDAALGLNIKEGDDGARYMPVPTIGLACGCQGDDDEITDVILAGIREAPKGVFVLSGFGVGLCEWAGWDEFNSALSSIVDATRDPAFEPRSLQLFVLRCARGAVKSGHLRQAEILQALQDKLSPKDGPEDAAPALRSAISRRTRLALACVVDAIASQGLGPEAGPDSMGLVGQLPRLLFTHIFDNIDDRDKGACAFLGEIVNSWDRRRCFSKRWLQEATGKFTIPKGVNSERDEGKGWYALTAENLGKTPLDAPAPNAKEDKSDSEKEEKKAKKKASRQSDSPRRGSDRSRSPRKEKKGKEAKADDDGKKKKKVVQNDPESDDDAVAKSVEESRKRRAALMAKYDR